MSFTGATPWPLALGATLLFVLFMVGSSRKMVTPNSIVLVSMLPIGAICERLPAPINTAAVVACIGVCAVCCYNIKYGAR
jgi:hypothetical protein